MPKSSAYSKLPKVKFTPEEDDKLIRLIDLMGTRDWEAISIEMKVRSPRQCRDRWNNYLSPSLTSQPWTEEEDKLLDKLYNKYGSRWTKIASYFRNRSANGVRNRFRLREKKKQMDKVQSPAEPVAEQEPAPKQPMQLDIEEQFFSLFDTTSFNLDFNLLPENLFIH